MIVIAIVIFVLIGLTILFGSHLVLYLSIVNFFSIENFVYKNILFYVLAFLAVSYILASIIARWNDNILTRAYYFISGTWLGFLTNFVLASILIWLIIWISGWLNFNADPKILGWIFFSLAGLFSIYGVWNAMCPQIKNITVTIPNLPAEWKGKKIVQLSDMHIGHVYRTNFVKDIVAKVNSIRPEMVLFTGDLYDGMDGDLDTPTKYLDDIRTVRGMYYITGNHETYLGVNLVFAALQKTKINILKDQVIDVGGLKIIGIDYPLQGEKKDLGKVIQSLEKDFQGKPNILMYHSPTNIDQFKNAGVNLQLSGHTHLGQIWPFRYVTDIVYKGYDYGLFKMGDYTLYTTNGVGTWGPAMRTGNTPEIVVVTLQ